MNNYASDSLKYNGPSFNEDVVAMTYVAVDCIANSQSIVVLPSNVREGTAMHVTRFLVDTHNLSHVNDHTPRDAADYAEGPKVGAEATGTGEGTATEVARGSQRSAAGGGFAEGFELGAENVDGGAAHTSNGSGDQQPEEHSSSEESFLMKYIRKLQQSSTDESDEEQSGQRPVQQSLSDESSLDESSSLSSGLWRDSRLWPP